MANIISQDKRQQMNVTVPGSKIKRVRKLARHHRASISSIVEKALDVYFRHEEINENNIHL